MGTTLRPSAALRVPPQRNARSREARRRDGNRTEYAVVLSGIAMPLTYSPFLLASNDRDLMGRHANGPVMRLVGSVYFALVCLLAIAAPILLVATNGGAG